MREKKKSFSKNPQRSRKRERECASARAGTEAAKKSRIRKKNPQRARERVRA